MRCRRGARPLWWHEKFTGCGYRLTIGREAVIEILSCSKGHLSAEDIYMKLRTRYPNIGLTTVYRTLDVLAALGMVYRFDFGDNRSRYELAEGPKAPSHHHHLVCTECNRIIDYEDFIDKELELLKQTEKSLSKKYDFKINDHVIQFYGLCEKCNKKVKGGV